ncbi:MAG: class I SAM-dependent methyltransferase [Candidatus Gracilibacteria bacterium]|nr:class I SAM-dependent methyltransferase [Candidatus Gracilibacteria bacterium]
MNTKKEYDNYLSNRGINSEYYENLKLPVFLKKYLPKDFKAKILDIGCGFGQNMQSYIYEGYNNIYGIDISDEAIDICKKNGLNVQKINILDYKEIGFDFISINHVLEHIEKNKIIESLERIKKMLNPQGKLYISVPNAQSNTDCYWAFEDFTHTTLFTAGSLIFCLKNAGFSKITFIDPDGIEFSRPLIKQLKWFLLKIYKLNKWFWNHVTGSSYHKPSPKIFTWEIKVIAEND